MAPRVRPNRRSAETLSCTHFENNCTQDENTCSRARVDPLILFNGLVNCSRPTLRRTSALVTEWSQKWGHSDELSC